MHIYILTHVLLTLEQKSSEKRILFAKQKDRNFSFFFLNIFLSKYYFEYTYEAPRV